MGIYDVQRQLEAEQSGGFATGGGPRQEQRVDMTQRDARGALAQPRRPLMSTDQKLLLLGTMTAGLLAINTALLALLLVRL